MTATFVSLVNDAIDESGSDLGLYQTDGSDFTTNTDPNLNRFKTWVARSWKKIQQVAFDWQFLSNQAVVTVNPGLMFYNDGDITGVVGNTIDIYGSDDVLLFDNLPIGNVHDLTYTQYSNDVSKSFGYVNLTCSGDDPLENLSFKAGGDYFTLVNRIPVVSLTATTLPLFNDSNMFVDDTLSFILLTETGGLIGVYNNAGQLLSLDPATGPTRGFSGYSFSTLNSHVLDAIADDDFTLYAYNFNVSLPSGWVFADGVPDGYGFFRDSTAVVKYVVTENDTKAYLHSWKSFDFSEELAPDDYIGELVEIDPTTFQLIDHESISPSTVYNLTCLPWSVFSYRFDRLTNVPGTPVFISLDNTGRWRLFPHPDRPVTLKFEYNRKPQILTEFDDIPKGLPDDFMELIMWLAVRMYGEFDEQPSVQRRAERYYKDMLQRLMIKYRPKFRLAPARLY